MNLALLMARIEEVSRVRQEDLFLQVQNDLSGAVMAFLDDTEVFEFETLSQLSQWLDEQLGAELAAAGAATQEKPRCNHKH